MDGARGRKARGETAWGLMRCLLSPFFLVLRASFSVFGSNVPGSFRRDLHLGADDLRVPEERVEIGVVDLDALVGVGGEIDLVVFRVHRLVLLGRQAEI